MENLSGWKVVFDHMEPHTLQFPKPYEKLLPFQRMLVLRCIRPDKVVPAGQQFVEGRKSLAKVECFLSIDVVIERRVVPNVKLNKQFKDFARRDVSNSFVRTFYFPLAPKSSKWNVKVFNYKFTFNPLRIREIDRCY